MVSQTIYSDHAMSGRGQVPALKELKSQMAARTGDMERPKPTGWGSGRLQGPHLVCGKGAHVQFCGGQILWES